MEPAGERVSARTPVDFESRRIEEPAIEQSLESDLVEWMGGLVYRNVGHVSLEPAWVDESWMEISIPTTTERPETEHSAAPTSRSSQFCSIGKIHTLRTRDLPTKNKKNNESNTRYKSSSMTTDSKN